MRTLLLIPFLLLGGLQAAVEPAPQPVDQTGHVRVSGCPLPTGPLPADTRTTVRPLPDASGQSALQGNGKPQKALPGAAPRLAADRDGRALRHHATGPATAAAVELRPEQPRAPPAAPPF
jgi:hypothetical protein